MSLLSWQISRKSLLVNSFLAICFLVCGSRAAAAERIPLENPSASHYLVNGFDVVLIDVKVGNQFGYVFAVPYGSADDAPQFFGRAHFFEHMYARGSKKYPGHETLIQAMTRFGFDRNAATGLDVTYYFATGNDSQGLQAMEMHLAGLHGVDLEASSLVREKATVINEVIDSRPNQPTRAIFALPFSELLPPGHLLKGHHVGTHTTLDPMSAADLRELHGRIYRPGLVKLAVLGNFSTGRLTKDEVIHQLESALPKDMPRATYRPEGKGPVFGELEQRVLEIKSESDKVATIYFDLPDGVDFLGVESFISALASYQRGSVTDILRREMGWIKHLSGGGMRAGHQPLGYLLAELTDVGFAKRDEVVAYILAAVEAHKATPFPDAVLQHLRQSMVEHFRADERDLTSLVRQLPEWLLTPGLEPMVDMKWDVAAASLYTGERLMKGAQALNSFKAAYVFMGPTEFPIVGHDDIYNLDFAKRPFISLSRPEVVPTYDVKRVEVAEVHLNPIARGTHEKPIQQSGWNQKGVGWREVFTHDEKWTDRTLQLDLNFGPISPLEELALRAWVRSFKQSQAPELNSLTAKGIALGIGAGSGELSVGVTGKTGLEMSSLLWALRGLAAYTPSEEDLRRFKEELDVEFRTHEQDFPGSVVNSLTHDLLSPFGLSALEEHRELKNLTLAQIQKFRDQVFLIANKTFAVAGEIWPSEMAALRATLRNLVPGDLGVPTLHATAPLRLGDFVLEHEEPWVDANQSGVGVARVMALPNPERIKERSAMAVVRTLLHEQVFLKNRPLGYVQGVTSLMPTSRDHFIMFMGQVAEVESLTQLVRVWDAEVLRWLNREIDPEAITKAKQGLIERLSKTPASSSEGLETALGHLASYGDTRYVERMKQVLTDLTVDEIYAAADEFLHPSRAQLMVRKGAAANPAASLDGRCEDLLQSRRAVRERLTGQSK